MCIRTDGDEGLFAVLLDVQFQAPMRAGDVLEVTGDGDPGRAPAAGPIDFDCRGRVPGPPGAGESAAEVLDPPIVAVTATGTVVVPPPRAAVTRRSVCVDVGSTYTKAAPSSTSTTATLAGAPAVTRPPSAPTCCTALTPRSRRPPPGRPGDDRGTCCSSAGGGLRLAVVGYEALVTAEAGHRVGLSAGARVVHVAAGRLDRAGDRRRCGPPRPDVVLLVGGTDGGDAEVLLHNAARLAARPAGGSRWWWPATPTCRDERRRRC